MLRDVLQYDTTLDDATNRMSTSHRTCDVIFGAIHACVSCDSLCRHACVQLNPRHAL